MPGITLTITDTTDVRLPVFTLTNVDSVAIRPGRAVVVGAFIAVAAHYSDHPGTVKNWEKESATTRAAEFESIFTNHGSASFDIDRDFIIDIPGQ